MKEYDLGSFNQQLAFIKNRLPARQPLLLILHFIENTKAEN